MPVDRLDLGRQGYLDIKVTYDKVADAAYFYFVDSISQGEAVFTYPCDPVEVAGMINLDFDGHNRLLGLEVLGASAKLPQSLLDNAERIDVDRA